MKMSGGGIVQPPENVQRLSEIGISKSQSSRWQAIAEIPESYVCVRCEIRVLLWKNRHEQEHLPASDRMFNEVKM